MKIVYTGGGTSGHFYPLMAVSERVKRLAYKEKLVDPTEYYFASKNLDDKMLQARNINYSYIPSGKKRLYFSLLNYIDIFKIGFGVVIAFFKLLIIYPDIIFSKGGFDSVPTCLAAAALRIPIILHDSDSIPGRASLLISKFASRVAVSYPESILYYGDKNKVAHVGQPILDKYTPEIDFKRVIKESGRKNILIIGGSSGSVKINDTVLSVLPELISKYNVIHQTGQDNYNDVKSRTDIILESYSTDSYALYPSLDLSKIYRQVDLAITRAGSTLFELAAWQIPSIVIPISESVSRDQTLNADSFFRRGAVKVLNENNMTPNVLLSSIVNVFEKNNYQSMLDACKNIGPKNGADKIAEEIIAICYTHR
jgi:UDP-N-acetylglucosamine--N-acetylmuramyl-(pentapeptide) pyrophosphoryl-undecaprenol N-acetylglucosamine transferase